MTKRLWLTLPAILSPALVLATLQATQPAPAFVAQAAAPQIAAQAAPAAPAGPATQPVQAETISAAAVRADAGLDRLLPKRAEAIYQALARRFRGARAMEVVTFMDRYWRVAGNTGFNASLDHIKAALVDAGFTEGRPTAGAMAAAPGAARSRAWLEEYPNGGTAWEPVRFDVTIVESASGPTPMRVFDPIADYIAICINSFSTPPGGILAPLVDAGSGADPASYASLDVKGAVVLGDGSMRSLWQEAVRNRGAIGIISTAVPARYTRPTETPEVFQWGSVPYDEKARAFGFKASPRVADALRQRLRAGAVKVRVDIETRIAAGSPGRMLVAEIPGRERPDERVVMVAHIQEPGANDDASGCGTLLELARSLQASIAAKTIPPPSRTLTFVWGDEMRASREWLRADASRAGGTRFMISLDMTGEDTTKTGGTFLIEKEPDPSAVWPRPADPHTEWWGVGSFYKPEALKGSLLNDLYLAACLRRARDTGWNVQTNPYEGGSDHSVFLNAGVPALLATHFTDRYYHTNLDRPDKTSPAEMANVGIATGTTAMLLAASRQEEAIAIADIVARAARTRLDLEARQSAGFLERAKDHGPAEAGERVLMDAWKRWYVRALESVLTLPSEPAGEKLQAHVRKAIEQIGSRQ